MLRLFRNFLCLAAVLQVGMAVQAQQQPVKAVTAKAPAASLPKPAKPWAAPVPVKAAKTEPLAAPAKASKTEPGGASKPAKSEPATAPSKSANAKTEPAPATAKTVKSEQKSTAKAESTTKSAKNETGLKPNKIEHVVQKHTATPRPGLVPPPPPDTPTMFAGDGFPPGFGLSDYNNPAVLAGRRKDIASQLASAKKMLIDKEQRAKELKDKALQFEQLFSEGVISKRELESAQKDSVSASTELNDAKTQAVAYQNAMSRLDDRIKPKSVASKKNGKVKASAKSAVKVADSKSNKSVATPADSKSAVKNGAQTVDTKSVTKSAAAVDSNYPAKDSTAQVDLKATPGP